MSIITIIPFVPFSTAKFLPVSNIIGFATMAVGGLVVLEALLSYMLWRKKDCDATRPWYAAAFLTSLFSVAWHRRCSGRL